MRNYATQMDAAKRGIVTPEIETVAKKENRPVEFIMERVAKGTIAIPANINHKSLSAEAVGDGTRVKINVNLGISGDCKDYEMELRKVRMAVDMGAESIMDLSNYGKTNTFRKQLIDMSPAMIGTVPMYDAIGYLEKDLLETTAQDFLRVVEAHAQEGVDFMTIHAGINRRAVEAFMREGRKMNIVSRGGSLLFAWMQMTGNENPFFEYYDDVLDILRRCGAKFTRTEAGLVFEQAPLHGVDIDLADCPDLGPVLMVLGLLCEGTTVIRNAERLRIKESDRIAAMEAELWACGGVLSSEGGTITVQGCKPRLHAPEAPLSGHNDHRVVMSLTVLALAANIPLSIEGAEAVQKSWPHFFDALRPLGVEVHYAG